MTWLLVPAYFGVVYVIARTTVWLQGWAAKRALELDERADEESWL